MAIQTKATAQTRAKLQEYFSKRAGQMPTKAEWFKVLDSNINIKDDMNLEQSDIKDLVEDLAKKADKNDLPKLPSTDEQFNALKDKIEALINEKTATIAAAASKNCTPQLDNMLTDSEPVGRIAQYIGEDDDFNRLYAGFFYKKIREHNPNDEQSSAAAQEGDAITIENVQEYIVDGVKYIGNYNTQNQPTADLRAQMYKANNRYIVFAVTKEALYNYDGATLRTLNDSAVFPIGYDTIQKRLVTTSIEDVNGYPTLIVNGEEVNNVGNLAHYANLVIRESDGKAFRLWWNNPTDARVVMLIPMYADDLYDIAADEELYFTQTGEEYAAFTGETRLHENYTVTPRLPIRGTSDYNTDPAWKMIPVSPFILDE